MRRVVCCFGLEFRNGYRPDRDGGMSLRAGWWRGLGSVTGNDGAVRRGRGGGMVVHHRWG
jgi:hypothetical protein